MKFTLHISVEHKSGPEVPRDDVLDALCYKLWSNGGLAIHVNDDGETPSLYRVTGADDRD